MTSYEIPSIVAKYIVKDINKKKKKKKKREKMMIIKTV